MYPKIIEHYIDAVMEENTLASYLNLLFPFKTSLRILKSSGVMIMKRFHATFEHDSHFFAISRCLHNETVPLAWEYRRSDIFCQEICS